jgi:hypothetical protein
MSNCFCSRGGLWCGIVVLGLQGLASTASAQIVCAGTPAAAIKLGALTLAVSDGSGYRVAGVRWDPVLRQSWATIVSCGHPEWPGLSLRVGEMNTAPHEVASQVREEHSLDVPIVHAGDIVHLWWQEDLLRIEVTGVAEENGSLGKTIRVRLLRRNAADQSTEEEFTGIVRGPSDVERQP